MKGAPPKPLEPQSWDMINICTKYGFDILIISGRYMYMVDIDNPVLRLKTRSQTCVGGISHLNLVNWTLDMKNQ